MSEKKLTIGQAIDQIIEALGSLDEVTRQTAINAACSHLGLSNATQTKGASENNNSDTATPSDNSHQGKIVDVRTFKELKEPKSAVQMACVVAFYLQEIAPINERKQAVSTEDLDKYFKQAKFQLPKNISVLLRDAKVAGYFNSAPGKGEYSLNAVGYNLVAHNLPKAKS